MQTANRSGAGYFGIGIYQVKEFRNVGTLWRGAYQLGAAFIFTIGKRYRLQPTDVTNVWREIPLQNYASFDAFFAALPYSCRLIGVEEGGVSLPDFQHPQRAVYLLGAEDSGLPPAIQARCHAIVSIPSVRSASYNVAQAGTLVMYERLRAELEGGLV